MDEPLDPLTEAERALSEGAWDEARELLEVALEKQPERAGEAWEGLGWVGWWKGEPELTFSARERSFRIFRDAGRGAEAAHVAALIAADHREFHGDSAVGRGWLERARRLAGESRESIAYGMVLLIEADFAIGVDGDPATALERCEESIALGRRIDSPDLEAIGLAQEGAALVALGEVERGIRSLDEALTIATHEKLDYPFTLGWSICCMIGSCEMIGDFKRATQWCDRARQFIERWGGRQLLGVCRSAYGNVLATYGDWQAADGELTGAVEDLTASRPGMAPGAIVRLAELRIRQGRLPEARELLDRAGPRGTVCRGELAMVDGDPEAAAELAARAMRQTPEDALLARLPALELRARAEAACGRPQAAAAAVRELGAVAECVPTPYVRGRVCRARGRLAEVEGDPSRARECFEDSIDAFAEASAPYDAAVVRVDLGRALAAVGRRDVAEREIAAAREVLSALGADADLRVASMDRRLSNAFTEGGSSGALRGDVGVAVSAAGPAGLTKREIEVLRLVADGMSDAEIAEELVLSPHTVHRHVANVRSKLGAGSRAEAVAVATRAGHLE